MQPQQYMYHAPLYPRNARPLPTPYRAPYPGKDERFFPGPFFPFVLGGLAGLAVSPFFFRPPYPYPCYGYPCGPGYGPGPGPYGGPGGGYGGPGYGAPYGPGY
ncbi:hypothetical protein ACFFGV_01310 [Pontibacillus salicampi]|uniref:Spore coat protein n=1 Tax=Pontibacillus salicampi TaxID=1449801 RepID=A0ABV6LIQ4_9BACI